MQVGASLELQSLNGNPVWKFEAAAKAKDRWRTCRGPQARYQKFESLEFESLIPREFERLKVKASKFESSENFKLWGVKGLKLSSFEGLNV